MSSIVVRLLSTLTLILFFPFVTESRAYTPPVEFHETLSVVVTEQQVDDWLPGENRDITFVAMSADGSRAAFVVGATSSGTQHLYTVYADGSGLLDLTPVLPAEVDVITYLRLNNDGSRLFFRSPAVGSETNIYVCNLTVPSCRIAIVGGISGFDGRVPYQIDETGDWLYFKHDAGWDPVSQTFRRGLFAAPLGDSPVLLMNLSEFPCWSECGNMNMLAFLDASSNGDIVVFAFNDDYWGVDHMPATRLWALDSSGPASLDGYHNYVWDTQNIYGNLVSQDGTVILDSHIDTGMPEVLRSLDYPSGGATLLARSDENGSNVDALATISPDGTLARFLDHGYLSRIEIASGTERDLLSEWTEQSLWSGLLSGFSADNARYFFINNSPVNGSMLLRADVDQPPANGSAPAVEWVEFTAPALLHEEGVTIGILAKVSDPDGYDDIEWVRIDTLVEGQHIPDFPMARGPLAFPYGDADNTLLYDDGVQGGDAVAGDGVFTFDSIATRKGDETWNTWYSQFTLPHPVGIRIVVKDRDHNYRIVDVALTITDDPQSAFGSLLAVDEISTGDDWSAWNLPVALYDPVVIATPPTSNGPTPGVVRMHNVTSVGLDVRFQEWDYIADGFHAQEEVGLLAVQAGRYPLQDGSVWEAGTVEIADTGVFQYIPFSLPFPEPPQVFLTLQTQQDAQAVTVRASNVGLNGFWAALFEQESLMDGHGPEILGYLAIADPDGTGSFPLASGPLPYQFYSGSVDHQWASFGGEALRLEEERSADDETEHAAETVSLLEIGTSLFAQDVTSSDPDTVALRRGSTADWDGDGIPDAEDPDDDNDGIADWADPDPLDDAVGVDPIWPPGLTAQANHTWTLVDEASGSLDAVVIAGPPTYHGSDPGVVRLKNITDLGFDIRFQEWDYRQRDFGDSYHALEDIPYVILQPGRHLMSDGSEWDVGTFDLGGTGTWQGVFFSQPFANPPHLYLSVQTNDGGQAVSVRAKNVTPGGFEAALFEEEALMDGHLIETIGYLAIHSPASGGLLYLDGVQVPYLLQSLNADERWSPVLSQRIKVEEERSLDTETGHIDETLHVLALGNQVLAQQVSHNGGDTTALRRLEPTKDAPMEWGIVRGTDHGWQTLPFTKAYSDPVLIAKPASNRGADPGVIRIQGVISTHAQLRYEEWDYLDDKHWAPEDVFYLVSEAGAHSVGGLSVEADQVITNKLGRAGQWEPIPFNTFFMADPVVLASVMTYTGADTVTTRIHNLDLTGFELAMDEQESKSDGHINETLGWIAIQQGSGTTAEGRKVGTFFDRLDHALTPVSYPSATTHRHPTVVNDIDSTFGADPVVLRCANPGNAQIELKLTEEQSADTETGHVPEDVGVFVGE